LRKDNTGYDMKSVFIGSEGTLGIVTRVSLKLFPQPRQSSTAFVALASPAAAVELLTWCRARAGGQLEAFELFSASQLDIILRHIPGMTPPLNTPSPWAALIEMRGPDDTGGADSRLSDILESAFQSGVILDATIAASLAQAGAFWRIRHSVSQANRLEGLNFTHDTAVPISRVPEFLRLAEIEVARRFPDAATYCVAHLGDGNVHFTVTFPFGRTPDHDLGAQVTRCVHDLAVGLGGSFGAEHGIGQRYRASLIRYKSEMEIDLFRTLKSALDPRGILNPGKVL